MRPNFYSMRWSVEKLIAFNILLPLHLEIIYSKSVNLEFLKTNILNLKYIFFKGNIQKLGIICLVNIKIS